MVESLKIAQNVKSHTEMVILLKTAQKPRRRAGIEDHLVNDSPVALPPSNMETLVHTYLGGLFLV